MAFGFPKAAWRGHRIWVRNLLARECAGELGWANSLDKDYRSQKEPRQQQSGDVFTEVLCAILIQGLVPPADAPVHPNNRYSNFFPESIWSSYTEKLFRPPLVFLLNRLLFGNARAPRCFLDNSGTHSGSSGACARLFAGDLPL